MDMQPMVGRRTTRLRRLRALSLLVLGIVAGCALGATSPAQAHEPYVVKAWGNNTDGELGDGSTSGPEMCGGEHLACSTTPVPVTGLSRAIATASGRRFSLALLEDGTVMAWGAGSEGQLGNGSENDSPVPVVVKGLSHVEAIAAGWSYALALLEDGTVMAWGANSQGELGDGITTSSDVPVAVTGLSQKVKAIAAGETHALALLEDGTVVAWGKNSKGELGNGTTTKSTVPVAVEGLSEKVKAIAAGESHSLALLEGGSVMAWGENKFAQLGNGTETNSDVAVHVGGLAGVRAISAGGRHNLALLNEKDTVMAWGLNTSGQLGDGTSEGPEKCGQPVPTFACAKTPVPVQRLAGGISAVAAGLEHNLIVFDAGAVVAWGRNEQGQLGDGLSTGPEGCGIEGSCSTLPVSPCAEGAEKVICSHAGPLLAHIKAIAAGVENSLALVPLPPIVTAVSPNEPRKKGRKRGTTVTITGTEFEEATEVKFGTVKATGLKVSADGTLIESVAPAGKGTVDVTVTTPLGTSPTSPADRFFYSRPVVKKISPNKGPELGGTKVTITGSSLSGVTAVNFGSTEATSFEQKSETEIVVVSPAHKAERVYVTVVTPNGTSLAKRKGSKDKFRYF